MQPRGSQAAVDERGRHRASRDGLAVAAGILGTNVAMDEEAGRLDVQLLADVLPDLYQVGTAFSTRAGGRFVAMLYPGQFRRQGIATGPFILAWGTARFLPVPLGDDGGSVLVPAIDEQIPLRGG